jgi:hypothetical protein
LGDVFGERRAPGFPVDSLVGHGCEQESGVK